MLKLGCVMLEPKAAVEVVVDVEGGVGTVELLTPNEYGDTACWSCAAADERRRSNRQRRASLSSWCRWTCARGSGQWWPGEKPSPSPSATELFLVTSS
jgi:hypothetical protein